MKLLSIFSCLPSGRGRAAGGGTGYKSNEICYVCIVAYLLGGVSYKID